MRRLKWGMLALTITCCISCGGDDAAGSLDVNLDVNLILRFVNENRNSGAMCGSEAFSSTSALVWNDALAKAALDHSNDMQANGYFSHESQDGHRFPQRAQQAGYVGSPVGENIAKGQTSEESVIQGWMESPGHCKNIMNSNARHIGIARSNEGNLWTMVLGR